MGKKAQPQRQDNDEPRPGIDRPTPERRKKGRFRQVDTENAGESYYIDSATFDIDDMHDRGSISPEQWQAVERFADRVLAYRAQAPIKSGSRSCLDFSPVGHDDSDGDPQVSADCREISDRLGFYAFNLLDASICRGESIQHREGVVWALDQLVDLWGLTTAKKWLG